MEDNLKPGEDDAPPATSSSASSHFPLEPVNGLVLLRSETARRAALLRRGNCLTGCREVDEEVLAGGFERGCVVGISAEQENFGLLTGLQTIARLLIRDSVRPGGHNRPRVMIITPVAVGGLLPMLRGVLEAQAVLLDLDPTGACAVARACLEQISISRVFDMEGLWEVLQQDLIPVPTGVMPDEPEGQRNSSEVPPPAVPTADMDVAGAVTAPSSAEGATARSPAQPSPPARRSAAHAMEIMDSEDEDVLTVSSGSSELSSPPPSSPHPAPEPEDLQLASRPHEPTSVSTPISNAPHLTTQHIQSVVKADGPRSIAATPEVILVTHMSALLAALFRSREKQSAHTMLELLSSHLRHVSRSPEYGCPLVMLLNATSSPAATTNTSGAEQNPQPLQHPQQPADDGRPMPLSGGGGGGGGPGVGDSGGRNRPLDPSLRSIFNVPHDGSGLGYQGGGGGIAAVRRNKPVYGLVFTQLLDLHLLATLVPRSREDAEALFGGGGGGGGLDGLPPPPPVRYVWIVEVLLDEVGAWQGGGGGHSGDVAPGGGNCGSTGATTTPWMPRVFREQRWGAVEVKGGTMIVDAFDPVPGSAGLVRVRGGSFGGPRA